MPERLFGTDGIRGPAGLDRLAPSALARLGLAVAHTLTNEALGPDRETPPSRSARTAGTRAGDTTRPRVLLGRDTRISGPAVAAAVTAGLLTGGCDVEDGGVLPTPAVALLTRRRKFALGVVISASHNPWPDNGLKLLGAGGAKLDDAAERAVERAFRSRKLEAGTEPEAVGRASVFAGASDAYERALLSECKDVRLRRLHVVVDPGHGAQSGLAAKVLRQLGAKVTEIHADPNGRNINAGCGALDPRPLRRAVKRLGADAGVAFDGDADRLQLVDEKGRLMDGDVVLAALAPRLLARRRLPHRTVVGTLMTNGALEVHLREQEINLLRTPVGDRHIVAAMTAHGYGLGGEPSGHLLFPRRGLLTGDGLVAAIACLRILAEERITASELGGGYRPWPLEIVSFKVRAKHPIEDLAESSRIIAETTAALGPAGRIVVRYSGTEPKVRVMVEARRKRDLKAALDPIVAALQREVGADVPNPAKPGAGS